VAITPIHSVQGVGLRSPLAGEHIETQGVVTGADSKGFFIQDAKGNGDTSTSDAIFVYSPRSKPPVGALVKVSGKVVDFQHDPDGNERPTTQIMGHNTEVIAREGPSVEPVWLTANSVPEDPEALAQYLNSLEGMLVGIEPGATFIAPSNPFGDYVVLPKGSDATRTPHGGVIIDPKNPHRWYPGFRIRSRDAPQVNVGGATDQSGDRSPQLQVLLISDRGPGWSSGCQSRNHRRAYAATRRRNPRDRSDSQWFQPR